MVRHGTLKKRRSGRKVTRKAPKHRALKIRNAINDQYVKEHWDMKKSPRENLLSMGLNPNPNSTIQGRNTQEVHEELIHPEKAAFMGFVSLPTGTLEEKNPLRKVLSRSEQEYLIDLMNKYGTNFKKMSHDLTLNHLQYTEQKLSKMYQKYLTLRSDQKISKELKLPTTSTSHQ